LPRQVSIEPSLNATVRRLPFLVKSVAMWLAIAALPPLPMNISLLPCAWVRMARCVAQSYASDSESGRPVLSVHAVAARWRASVSK
jgi:hypothetical protein